MAKASPIVQAGTSTGSAAGASSTGSHTREEMRAFLQRRVSRFGRLLALMFGLFFAWRLTEFLRGDDSPSQAFLPWQGLSVAAFAAIWLFCRGRPRSIRFIQVVEESGLLIGCIGAMGMALHISYPARPDYILILSLSYVLVVRSILVPSTARMTLLFGILLGAAMLVSIYFIHLRGHDPTIFSATSDPRLRKPASEVAAIMTMVAAMWWIVATAIATAASRVIYGLREEVRDARKLGQYTLLEKLGEGGMGVVYLARHAMLRRPTAVKLLPPERFGAESVARFEREVQQTARLTHPNTIRIFDYGRTPDGIFYYAMEYLEGASLADVIAEGGPMPSGRVIHVLDQAAGALTEAHGIGLIHRDIKPANIFLTEQGGIPDVAKVLDFGLVKEVTTSGDDATAPAITQANSFAGTPLYMAPEAITAPDKVDSRTDLYALGAVGYFLLTGKDVFTGRNLLEICGHHLHTEPVPPSERLGARIATDLEKLILSCLSKDPADRPSDARTLQSALRQCRDARTWTEEDARHWTTRHAVPLRARQRRASVGSEATLEVDLGLRSPGEPNQRQAG